jgi:signal transduction histidine kinase
MTSFFRTLRFRIAAAFFFWTGLIQIALLLSLPVARDVFVVDGVDRRLGEVGSSLVGAAERGAPADSLIRGSAISDPDPNSIQVQVRDQAGKLLAASSDAHDLPSLGDQFQGTVTYKPAVGGPERFRVVTFTAHPPEGPPIQIETALSLRLSDDITRSLRNVLALALLVGLLGSAAAGWIVSGAVISRIDRVSKAVREVAPTRLDTRIQIPTSNDEIGRMAADVNTMLERMAVAFRSQERFMSEVSHELKTPLSALLTEAQVLKRQVSRPAPGPVIGNGTLRAAEPGKKGVEPYERFVLSVEEEMRWLGKLVESFLMLARFGHGKQFVAETVVPINDVVLDAVEHSSLYARQHGVTLALNLHDPGEASPEAVVRGDSELLRVVADNLIRNAVQFSKRGDSVTVKVDVEASDGSAKPDTVVFTVKDQGPGVPPEYLTRIFDRFQQAPTKGATRRGSGLGLTIAKGVTDLHGGAIDARNDPAGGCVFRVRLPVHTPPLAPGAPSTPEAQGTAGRVPVL